GFLASAVGMYSFAARFGLVPSDFSSAVGWVSRSSAPLLPGTPLGAGGSETFPQSSPSGYSSANQSAAGSTANYQNTGSSTANYGGGDIACYFSPLGGCTDAVVNEIRQARQQILVQAYSFTSVPI